jgi:hypothetical protein
MMRTYEFMTQVTPDGKLLLPNNLAKDISRSESVRVILVIESKEKADERVTPVLEQLVTEIQNTPQNPESVQLAAGSLLAHLVHPINDPDPKFNVDIWNAQWDQIERQMDHEELEATEN